MSSITAALNHRATHRTGAEFLNASDIVRQFVQLTSEFVYTLGETLVLGDGLADFLADYLSGGRLSDDGLAVTDSQTDDVVIRELSARKGGLKFDTEVGNGSIEHLACGVGAGTEGRSLGRDLLKSGTDPIKRLLSGGSLGSDPEQFKAAKDSHHRVGKSASLNEFLLLHNATGSPLAFAE